MGASEQTLRAEWLGTVREKVVDFDSGMLHKMVE